MTRATSLFLLSLCGLAWAGPGDTELSRAAELPFVAQELRAGGLPEGEVRVALKAFREAKLSAGDAEQALTAAEQGVKRSGPIDNFGAFVQSQLDSGLRGRQLAEAIRAEHEARGKGGGRGKSGEEHGKSGEEHGKSGEDHGKSGEDHGKSGEDRGKSGEEHGKSGEDHGKSGEDHGKSGEDRGKSGGKQGKGQGKGGGR